MIFEPGREPGPPTRAGCAVLGLLVAVGAGWLATAVQKVRDAAARLTCHGRHCQLALALHNYASTQPAETFPPGTVPHPDLPPDRRLSWYVPTLDFVEEQSLRRRFDLSAGFDAPANAAGAATPCRRYLCATRRDDPNPPAVADSVGVAGVGDDAADLPAGHPRAGVFGHDRRTRLADVADGTANTLLLLEDGRAPGPWARGGRATVRAVGPGGRPSGILHRQRDGWRRPFVTVAVMADGSARTFASDLDPTVLAALATAAGGESLPPD